MSPPFSCWRLALIHGQLVARYPWFHWGVESLPMRIFTIEKGQLWRCQFGNALCQWQAINKIPFRILNDELFFTPGYGVAKVRKNIPARAAVNASGVEKRLFPQPKMYIDIDCAIESWWSRSDREDHRMDYRILSSPNASTSSQPGFSAWAWFYHPSCLWWFIESILYIMRP